MARNNSASKRSGSSPKQTRSASAAQSANRSSTRASAPGESSSRRSQTSGRTSARRQQSRQSQPISSASSGRGSPQSGIRDMGSRAMSTLADHPIPLAMIGAGLAMFLLENRTGLANAERRMISRGRDMLDTFGESLAEYTSTARDALSPVTESVSDGASRVGQYLGSGASSVGQGVENAYEYGRDALADAWERHPVMLCASILAAGLAAGMLLPATRRENSLLGRTSDAVARKLRQQGREFISQGRELVNDAAQTVTETVSELGLGPNQPTGARSGGVGRRSQSKRNRRARR